MIVNNVNLERINQQLIFKKMILMNLIEILMLQTPEIFL
jgi:hypothetical protein